MHCVLYRVLFKRETEHCITSGIVGRCATVTFTLRRTFFYYYWYSALGPVWAETRAQSGDWYGSGTLHPGQLLRGSLPLLSPAFCMFALFLTRCLHVRHDVRDPSGGSGNCGRECSPVILPKWRLPRHLGIFYMPQIYDMRPTAHYKIKKNTLYLKSYGCTRIITEF